MKKSIQLQRNSFLLGLCFSNIKSATCIRGFAMDFRPRSLKFKVGVRPILEVRPSVGGRLRVFIVDLKKNPQQET